MDMYVKPRRLVTIVAVVVGSFLMSFGVAYAASADGSLYKFTTFHSSGVKLCGYDRASISTTSSSYAAWGWVSTRDGGCTAAEAHSRPAGTWEPANQLSTAVEPSVDRVAGSTRVTPPVAPGLAPATELTVTRFDPVPKVRNGTAMWTSILWMMKSDTHPT